MRDEKMNKGFGEEVSLDLDQSSAAAADSQKSKMSWG